MTLENLWRRQLAFNTEALPVTHNLKLDQLTEDNRILITKDTILALHAELDEVLNTVPWKSHRFIGPTDREALLEELVDVQKFLFNLMQTWGMTPLELEYAFNRKSDVVEQRFFQDHKLPSLIMNRKVAIVDIDDVVADWEGGFISWVEQVEPDLNSSDFEPHQNPGLRARLKKRIHSEGGMLSLPVLKGARDGISSLTRSGYTIVWLTARPVSKHPRLRADTIHWLQQNEFPSDYVYFSDLNKHVFVVEKFPYAAVIFDDKPEIIQHAHEFGIEAFEVHAQDGNTLEDAVREFL